MENYTSNFYAEYEKIFSRFIKRNGQYLKLNPPIVISNSLPPYEKVNTENFNLIFPWGELVDALWILPKYLDLYLNSNLKNSKNCGLFIYRCYTDLKLNISADYKSITRKINLSQTESEVLKIWSKCSEKFYISIKEVVNNIMFTNLVDMEYTNNNKAPYEWVDTNNINILKLYLYFWEYNGTLEESFNNLSINSKKFLKTAKSKMGWDPGLNIISKKIDNLSNLFNEPTVKDSGIFWFIDSSHDSNIVRRLNDYWENSKYLESCKSMDFSKHSCWNGDEAEWYWNLVKNGPLNIKGVSEFESIINSFSLFSDELFVLLLPCWIKYCLVTHDSETFMQFEKKINLLPLELKTISEFWDVEIKYTIKYFMSK